MPDTLLNLKLDIVFQELFGRQKNCEITRHLLSLILKREIYSIDLSVVILIADFDLEQTEGISYYHTKWNLREEKHRNKILTNDIELHILEIQKITDIDIQKEELAQWLKFIDNPESEEVKKFMCENKFYKQAMEELAYMSGDPNFKYAVEDRVRFLMDQETIISAEKLEIAKKMKAKEFPIDEISELTGLSKEEIEKL